MKLDRKMQTYGLIASLLCTPVYTEKAGAHVLAVHAAMHAVKFFGPVFKGSQFFHFGLRGGLVHGHDFYGAGAIHGFRHVRRLPGHYKVFREGHGIYHSSYKPRRHYRHDARRAREFGFSRYGDEGLTGARDGVGLIEGIVSFLGFERPQDCKPRPRRDCTL